MGVSLKRCKIFYISKCQSNASSQSLCSGARDYVCRRTHVGYVCKTVQNIGLAFAVMDASHGCILRASTCPMSTCSRFQSQTCHTSADHAPANEQVAGKASNVTTIREVEFKQENIKY